MKHFIACQWVSQGSLFHPFWSPNTRAMSGGWFWEAGNALFLPPFLVRSWLLKQGQKLTMTLLGSTRNIIFPGSHPVTLSKCSRRKLEPRVSQSLSETGNHFALGKPIDQRPDHQLWLSELSHAGCFITHRIHGAAIYGNMDPINIPQMLAYIPAPWIRHGL